MSLIDSLAFSIDCPITICINFLKAKETENAKQASCISLGHRRWKMAGGSGLLSGCSSGFPKATFLDFLVPPKVHPPWTPRKNCKAHGIIITLQVPNC